MAKDMRIKEIVVFLALSFGLAWLATLPLWLDDRGLKAPYATLCLIVMMATPSLGVLGVFVVFRPADLRETLGLRFRQTSVSPWVLAFVVPLVAVALSLVVAWAVGLYAVDFAEFSGFRALVVEQGGGEAFEEIGINALVAISVLSALAGGLVNSIPAFGEELGWRGFLLPRLLPLGTAPALLLSGVIWGLWHTPALLLGHNYPANPVLGVPAFVVVCILLGTLLGWLRLKFRSVFPAALAHGAVNAAAGLAVLFSSAEAPVDPFLVGLTGLSGWIVMALLIGLAMRARFTPAFDAAPS